MKTYQATLFHPSGDCVTDFHDRESIKAVWDEVSDMGSRWIFYPLAFVTTEKTIVDTPEGLEGWKRKRIRTVRRILARIWEARKDEICNLMNDGGYPLDFIFPEAKLWKNLTSFSLSSSSPASFIWSGGSYQTHKRNALSIRTHSKGVDRDQTHRP